MDQAKLYTKVNNGQRANGEQLIQLANPQAGEHVLDIGAGTGELTYQLAKQITSQGKLIAIEPDKKRLDIAKANQPSSLTNINWLQMAFDTETFTEKQFDLVFSNYVFHWLSNKEIAIKAVYQQLKPGGRFAFCAVFDHPPCMKEVLDMAGEAGIKIRDAIQFSTKETWLNFFKKAGFRVVVDDNITPYYHPDIDDFLTWLEATSHGVFQVDQLSSAQLKKLRTDHPGELYLHTDCTLRLVAHKD